jgi:hypothetical protein
MGEQTRLYLRDVLDHVLCLFDDIEMAKEQLTHLTNTYLARVSIQMAEVSNQLNGIMKKFNAMATIILPLTFVTGLYRPSSLSLPSCTVERVFGASNKTRWVLILTENILSARSVPYQPALTLIFIYWSGSTDFWLVEHTLLSTKSS